MFVFPVIQREFVVVVSYFKIDRLKGDRPA